MQPAEAKTDAAQVQTETALTGEAAASESRLTLRYRQPARALLEALAIGNGRLGAMTRAVVRSKLGGPCQLRAATSFKVTVDGRPVETNLTDEHARIFLTAPGKEYDIIAE